MIFFAFSSSDTTIVMTFKSELERLGHEIWSYNINMIGTDSWKHYLHNRMQAADRCVLFISEASMSCRQVSVEWQYFYDKNLPLHPVVLEKTEKMPPELRACELIYFDQKTETTINRLDRYLNNSYYTSNTNAKKDGQLKEDTDVVDIIKAVRNGNLDSLSLEDSKRLQGRAPETIEEYLGQRALRWHKIQADQRLLPRLTLLTDERDAPGQWSGENPQFQFSSAIDLLDETSYPAIVALGEPGAGKSTMLGRLESDLVLRALAQPASALIPFCVALGEVRLPENIRNFNFEEWVEERWGQRYPKLPPIKRYIQEGKVVFLLDGLNEVAVDDQNGYLEFSRRVRQWLYETCLDSTGNRAVFTCRSRDYAGILNSPDNFIPYVRLSPISREQINAYLNDRLSAQHKESVKERLPELVEILSNPLYLNGFCGVVESQGRIPVSRADIVGSMIRLAVQRTARADKAQLHSSSMLSTAQLANLRMHDSDRMGGTLLDSSLLIGWSAAAMHLQAGHGTTDMGLVIAPSDIFEREFIKPSAVTPSHYAVACEAGIVVEHDNKSRFCHQLFQEFLSALAFKSSPDWSLTEQYSYYLHGRETLSQALVESSANDLLPPIPRTGWEMTLAFVLDLAGSPKFLDPLCMIHPIAAFELLQGYPVECEYLAILEHKLEDLLKNPGVDLRMRVRAGDLLGQYRTRAQRHTHKATRWIEVPAGCYKVGSDHEQFPMEQPKRTVKVDRFEIACLPITNAEFNEFIEDNGYHDSKWWVSDAATAWRNGHSRIEAIVEYWNKRRALIARSPEKALEMLRDGRASLSQAASMFRMANLSQEELSNAIRDWFAAEVKDKPRFWEHSTLGLPYSPVVGVSIYEVEAYCAWRSARDGQPIRLLSEWEWEVAASGSNGLTYPTSNQFNAMDMNTAELRLDRTTPVGVFIDKASWCGVLDMSGNIFEWTSSPYGDTEDLRVCRGGSWRHSAMRARVSYRGRGSPYVRNDDLGFRIGRG